uniref:DNA-directed primase/polymerase protein n=1 Tax=Saccoglossus kowalevskii TaxID=10224 RepID=A0ABM0MAV1_SACKO|nr:PREDICTED: coiled-coil domain-containing protein 111-like [Saccoglossus kowalevskii]
MEALSPPRLTLAQERKLRERRWRGKLEIFKVKEEIYKHHFLAPEYRPRLTDPSPLWREFHRQKQAFNFTATGKEDMHVFAVDVDESGQRRYIVTSYQQLRHTVFDWKDIEPPHFYEIIPEGAACHLYFDLEYSIELNPESDGVAMVDIFIQCVCHFLHELYGIQCSRRNVIDLDATSNIKFSRHLIFRLPGSAFRDNNHTGNFVHHVCTAIANIARNKATNNQSESKDQSAEESKPKKQRTDHLLSDLDLNQLFVFNRSSERVLFVDEGVYTKNRNFRLYKCAKKGKTNIFELSKQNVYKAKQEKGLPLEYQMFTDSIISNVKYTSTLQILDCHGDASRRQTKLDVSNTESGTSPLKPKDDTIVEGFQHSPYPELDDYIKTQINTGGVKWMIVDLHQGVFYQKCHDPDCKAKNFKTLDKAVPAEFLPGFYDDLDDEELLEALQKMEEEEEKMKDEEASFDDDIDDETLLRAVEKIERQT